MSHEKIFLIHDGERLDRYWSDACSSESLPLVSYHVDDIEMSVRLMSMCDSVRVCIVDGRTTNTMLTLRRVARGLDKRIEEFLYTESDF